MGRWWLWYSSSLYRVYKKIRTILFPYFLTCLCTSVLLRVVNFWSNSLVEVGVNRVKKGHMFKIKWVPVFLMLFYTKIIKKDIFAFSMVSMIFCRSHRFHSPSTLQCRACSFSAIWISSEEEWTHCVFVFSLTQCECSITNPFSSSCLM